LPQRLTKRCSRPLCSSQGTGGPVTTFGAYLAMRGGSSGGSGPTRQSADVSVGARTRGSGV